MLNLFLIVAVTGVLGILLTTPFAPFRDWCGRIAAGLTVGFSLFTAIAFLFCSGGKIIWPAYWATFGILGLLAYYIQRKFPRPSTVSLFGFSDLALVLLLVGIFTIAVLKAFAFTNEGLIHDHWFGGN